MQEGVLKFIPDRAFVDARLKPDEVAKLWMNENSVVNAKVAYFTAVNAALGAALSQTASRPLAALVAAVGIAATFLALLSISRTCAYRQRFRQVLGLNTEYRQLFDFGLSWNERVTSNTVLKLVPSLALLGWGTAFYIVASGGPLPHTWR